MSFTTGNRPPHQGASRGRGPRGSVQPGRGRPRVGVVVGSWGVEAFACIPFLQLLTKRNLPVDLMVGASGGAFMAALWSAGYDLAAMQEIFSRLCQGQCMQVDTDTLMRMAEGRKGRFGPGRGLYTPRGLRASYEAIFKDSRLEELSPRTVLWATDIATGEPAVLDSGPIARAVLACGSLYPLTPPVEVDGRLLADGGYTSPLPVMEALQENVDVIAVVFFQNELNPRPANFLDSFMNMTRITSRALMRSQFFASVDMHHFEIVFVPVRAVSPVSLWDVEKIPEILYAGKLAAADAMRQMDEALHTFNNRPAP